MSLPIILDLLVLIAFLLAGQSIWNVLHSQVADSTSLLASHIILRTDQLSLTYDRCSIRRSTHCVSLHYNLLTPDLFLQCGYLEPLGRTHCFQRVNSCSLRAYCWQRINPILDEYTSSQFRCDNHLPTEWAWCRSATQL